MVEESKWIPQLKKAVNENSVRLIWLIDGKGIADNSIDNMMGELEYAYEDEYVEADGQIYLKKQNTPEEIFDLAYPERKNLGRWAKLELMDKIEWKKAFCLVIAPTKPSLVPKKTELFNKEEIRTETAELLNQAETGERASQTSPYSYTAEMEEWLKENIDAYEGYKTMTDAFNQKFGTLHSYGSIRNRCLNLGLISQCTKSTGRFKPKHDRWIKENVRKYSVSALTDLFNRTFPKYSVSKSCMSQHLAILKVKQLANTEPVTDENTVPATKESAAAVREAGETTSEKISETSDAVKAEDVREPETTAIEEININAEPADDGYAHVGDEMTDAAQNVSVCVAQGDANNPHGEWIPKKNYVYEKKYGKVIAEDEDVVMIDGTKNNFEESNLYVVKKAVRRYMLRHGMFTDDAIKNLDNLLTAQEMYEKGKLN